VTVTGQFIGYKPGLFGGDLNPVLGVGEIAFADGTVWDATDIAWAVAPNTDGVDGTSRAASGVLGASGGLEVMPGCGTARHHRQRGIASGLTARSVRILTVSERFRS
jgi:hypothetical protein